MNPFKTARERLSKHGWIREDLGDENTGFCMLGALGVEDLVFEWKPEQFEAAEVLAQAIKEAGFEVTAPAVDEVVKLLGIPSAPGYVYEITVFNDEIAEREDVDRVMELAEKIWERDYASNN